MDALASFAALPHRGHAALWAGAFLRGVGARSEGAR